ncbi:MAG TPA: hypothetical protein VJT73_02405 [Polyangiaceae bacterium]|nr:hypothetical protein [Polyangiaceae bacterium]
MRMHLSEKDRALLVLRVDQKLSWSEIASIFAGQNAYEEAQKRRAAALRKRFERIKEEIRLLALSDGIVGVEDS